jgi:hypothetical protein
MKHKTTNIINLNNWDGENADDSPAQRSNKKEGGFFSRFGSKKKKEPEPDSMNINNENMV